MTSKASSIVSDIVDPVMRSAGFSRDGLSWYRPGSESVEILNVQPSRLPTTAYINVGVYYLRFGDAAAASIFNCHASARLTSIVPDADKEMELLNVDNDMALSARKAELAAMIVSYALPWLHNMADFENACRYVTTSAQVVRVSPEARPFLVPPQTLRPNVSARSSTPWPERG